MVFHKFYNNHRTKIKLKLTQINNPTEFKNYNPKTRFKLKNNNNIYTGTSFVSSKCVREQISATDFRIKSELSIICQEKGNIPITDFMVINLGSNKLSKVKMRKLNPKINR